MHEVDAVGDEPVAQVRDDAEAAARVRERDRDAARLDPRDARGARLLLALGAAQGVHALVEAVVGQAAQELPRDLGHAPEPDRSQDVGDDGAAAHASASAHVLRDPQAARARAGSWRSFLSATATEWTSAAARCQSRRRSSCGP